MPPKRKAPKRKTPKRSSAKRKTPKRSPAKGKAPKRKAPKRKASKRKAPKRKAPKRKAPKRKAPKRSRPKRKPRYDVRQTDLGDAVVVTDDWRPPAGYQEYPIPEKPVSIYRRALDRLDESFGGSGGGGGGSDDGDDYDSDPDVPTWGDVSDYGRDDVGDDDGPEIVWLPTFDEVYDYIDALVEDYDLDPHELFELAFGYADNDAA